MKVPDVISSLLISNSRILKEKFIQLIKDDKINYESERVRLKNYNIQFSCYSPQNLNENDSSQICFKLIDAIDKDIINKLFDLTAKEKTELEEHERSFSIKSIIYVFDESNIDTFTFTETFHKELKNKYKDQIEKLKIPYLLCNLSNMLAIKTKLNVEDKEQSNSKLIEDFLADNKELQYTVFSSKSAKVGTTNEQINLVKNSYNKLMTKIKFQHYEIFDHDRTVIRSISRQNSRINQEGTKSKLGNVDMMKINIKERAGTYAGEIKDNLRNGNSRIIKILYKLILCFKTKVMVNIFMIINFFDTKANGKMARKQV